MSRFVFRKTVVALATVSCIALSTIDAEAATGISTTALGGGVVTVGSVGTNQMDGTADFTVAAGDTLVILGTDPVSGGGSTFGHKVILLPGATIQLDNDLIVNGDGTDALDVDGTVTIYTNTGNLTLNDRINNVGDPLSIVKTGAGTLTLDGAATNMFPTNFAAAPKPGIDAPEFDVQAGTLVNPIRIINNNNTHLRGGNNITTNGWRFTNGDNHRVEVGNNNTIYNQLWTAGGDNHTIVVGDDNYIEGNLLSSTGSNHSFTVGDRNTIDGLASYSIGLTYLGGSDSTLTIGEGNIFKLRILANGTRHLVHFTPGATANRIGENRAINTANSLWLENIGVANTAQGLHIEGMVEIAGGFIGLNDTFARLYATGSLTFTDPSIKILLNSSVFQLDQSYTFNNPIELAGAGSELKIGAGTTATINAAVAGAGQDLTISDTGALILNASVPQNIDLSSGGNFTLGAAGSVPGNVTGNNAVNQTFDISGTITGTLDTGNGDNIVNLNSGGTLGALTTGNGNDTIDIDGNITGATNLGDGINNVDVSASSTIGDITFGAGNDTITVWGKAGNIMLGAGVNVLSIGPGSVVGNITGDPAGTDTITVAGDTGVIDGVTGAITASQNSKITIKGITASLTMNDGACAAVTGGGQIAGNVTLNDNSKLIAQADSDFQGNVTANDSANITLGSSPSGTVTITNGTLTVPAGTAIGADINQAGIGNINIGAGASMTGALAFSQDTILENVKVKKASMAAGKKLTLRTSTVLEMAELTPAADVNTQIILDGTKVDMNTTTWANNISKMVIINDGTLFSSGSDNLSNVSVDNFSQNSLDLVTLNTTMSPSTAALTIASYNAYDPGNEGTLVVGIDTLAGSRSQWLSVVGNANITDSKLIVVANRDSTFNSYSDSYDVIEYGGVRTGTFATPELQNSERDVASGLTAAADYSNAGRVRISLAKLSNYADSLGANANQSAQIAALDASSNAFLNQLDWGVRMASSDNARLILDQVSAEGYQMLYQNDRNQAQNFNQAMFERSRQRLFERERPYHSTWITPSWNYARADNHGSYYGHEIKASGIDFGFDRKHKRYRMLSGLALGFRDSSSQSKLNLKDSGKHYHLGWYLHALSGPDHFMNLQASLSYNQHDSKRDIAAGDYTGRLTSDNNSYVLAADAKLGTHVFDNWGHSYTPYLALSTIYQDGDNIVESSNDTTTQNLALNVDKHNRWHGYIGLGSDMRLTRKNALIYNFQVKPVLSLEYLTEFSNNANKALNTAFSIDPDNKFAIHGIHVGRHTGSLGFSLEGLGLSKRTKGHFFNAGYNAKMRSQGNIQHAFNINYQWKW
jgi:hypothetical protein